jgi:hypothetical protein
MSNQETASTQVAVFSLLDMLLLEPFRLLLLHSPKVSQLHQHLVSHVYETKPCVVTRFLEDELDD